MSDELTRTRLKNIIKEAYMYIAIAAQSFFFHVYMQCGENVRRNENWFMRNSALRVMVVVAAPVARSGKFKIYILPKDLLIIFYNLFQLF